MFSRESKLCVPFELRSSHLSPAARRSSRSGDGMKVVLRGARATAISTLAFPVRLYRGTVIIAARVLHDNELEYTLHAVSLKLCSNTRVLHAVMASLCCCAFVPAAPISCYRHQKSTTEDVMGAMS